RLSDEEMVDFQRANLLSQASPNPSVETLLHAFLPAKFIDHTQAEAILALADQPDAETVVETAFSARVGFVPYVMPGFALAKRAAKVFEANSTIEGLILEKHGVFSFGASAKESYERMIALVSTAEAVIAARSKGEAKRPAPRPRIARLEPAAALPIVRGLLAEAAGDIHPRHWIFDLRSEGAARRLADHPRLAELAQRGVATPDHVIRTKPVPLILPASGPDAAAWRRAAAAALEAFVAQYRAYFARNAARAPSSKTPLDPLPRVLAIPGLGLVGVGQNAKAAGTAADIAASWARTLLAAEAVGRFTPVSEEETFDLEYWSLEQAKLGKEKPLRLAGNVVLITGAAGSIGSATARAFALQGAEIAALDLSEPAPGILPAGARFHRCDVSKAREVRAAFDAIAARFGGIDIVVSNAGSALAGEMAEMDERQLRASFDLNFFAHQIVAREAVRVFRAQGMGGALLFNVSKQAVNPGPAFGAYGTAKAALLALVRQYALEHGAEGVRVNAVNADRIRSGLLTQGMIAQRAKARGLSEEAYMKGNLLGREVTAEDVAEAFVFASLMRASTGAVITVDGGNIAAMMR
ncbi:MAG: bifunctional aldolase/short-chain dehydrogenase, partial [Caulobacteraceae bacterium]